MRPGSSKIVSRRGVRIKSEENRELLSLVSRTIPVPVLGADRFPGYNYIAEATQNTTPVEGTSPPLPLTRPRSLSREACHICWECHHNKACKLRVLADPKKWGLVIDGRTMDPVADKVFSIAESRGHDRVLAYGRPFEFDPVMEEWAVSTLSETMVKNGMASAQWLLRGEPEAQAYRPTVEEGLPRSDASALIHDSVKIKDFKEGPFLRMLANALGFNHIERGGSIWSKDEFGEWIPALATSSVVDGAKVLTTEYARVIWNNYSTFFPELPLDSYRGRGSEVDDDGIGHGKKNDRGGTKSKKKGGISIDIGVSREEGATDGKRKREEESSSSSNGDNDGDLVETNDEPDTKMEEAYLGNN